MIRNAWFYVFLIGGTLVFSTIACLFFWQSSGRVGAWVSAQWSRTMLWAAGVRCQADLDTMKGIPPEQGVVFMANHQSQLDIMVLASLLRAKRPVFVAKQSLFKIPVFGPAMLAAGHIPIDRNNRRKAMQSIDHATETLKGGRSIVIFPEGTRATDLSHLGEFKIGGMVLALKCKAPVVPLILLGSGRILPKGARALPAGDKTVTVTALPLFDPADYTLKERERFKTDLYERMNLAYLEQNSWPATNPR